ncbi:MAG: TSUP family transporter [bacterium]
MTVVALIACGLAAGILGGMLGVGGGIIFVPALVLIVGLSQVEAVATSLLAIIPGTVAAVWRQREYGNVRIKEGLLVGVLAIAGVAVGVVIANAVSGEILKLAFAALLVLVAIRMAMRALRPATTD